MDKILEQLGMKLEDLREGERETLYSWVDNLHTQIITPDSVKVFIASLKYNLEQDLTTYKETPTTWVSFIIMFIPVLGIMRKWYADQNKLLLEARLRNLILIEAFLSGPDRAQKALDAMIKNIASRKIDSKGVNTI
jgi:hypothetical protein